MYSLPARLQRSLVGAAYLLVGAASCVGVLTARPGKDAPTEVTVTADAAVALWTLAGTAMLWHRAAGWPLRGGRLELIQTAWATGAVAIVLHNLAAFAMVHRWSLDRAFAATKAEAGVGEGIYVNFAFAGVWAADAAWLLLAPIGYARRPRWVGRAVHGFLAFIVFSAVVVYAPPPVRAAGLGWFGVLAVTLAAARVLTPPAGGATMPGCDPRPPDPDPR